MLVIFGFRLLCLTPTVRKWPPITNLSEILLSSVQISNLLSLSSVWGEGGWLERGINPIRTGGDGFHPPPLRFFVHFTQKIFRRPKPMRWFIFNLGLRHFNFETFLQSWWRGNPAFATVGGLIRPWP